MIITICILSILLLVAIFVIWNLIRKNDYIEESYREVSLTNITMYEALQATIVEMHKIDDKGVFESDDEVGVVFKLLKETLISARELMGGDDE